eukprot:6210767-Pleurochrysis_carterae.AAC.1
MPRTRRRDVRASASLSCRALGNRPRFAAPRRPTCMSIDVVCMKVRELREFRFRQHLKTDSKQLCTVAGCV